MYRVMNNLFFSRTLFPEIKGSVNVGFFSPHQVRTHAGHGACKHFMFNLNILKDEAILAKILQILVETT